MLYLSSGQNTKDEIELDEDEIKILNLIREGKKTDKAFSIESHWEIDHKYQGEKETIYKLISAKLIKKFKF